MAGLGANGRVLLLELAEALEDALNPQSWWLNCWSGEWRCILKSDGVRRRVTSEHARAVHGAAAAGWHRKSRRSWCPEAVNLDAAMSSEDCCEAEDAWSLVTRGCRSASATPWKGAATSNDFSALGGDEVETLVEDSEAGFGAAACVGSDALRRGGCPQVEAFG